ncbi:MAG: sulfite exporter TauE/SafE family protein [Gammaproteobacteria bacterium]
MEIVIISLVALAASTLTFFSGFGLGTLLMPVVALFFPLEIAIGITAIVHLANNFFKIGLLYKHVNWQVFLRFGITALVFAFIGAKALQGLAESNLHVGYTIFQHSFDTSLFQFIIGWLILIFVVLELIPAFSRLSFDKKYLPIGGIISGFFGGLTGNQGAFRSMFLIKSGLTKEQFIATGVMVAIMVDITRLSVYGKSIIKTQSQIDWILVITACFSAFIGAYLGRILLKKVTIQSVHFFVSTFLLLVALGLISGLI